MPVSDGRLELIAAIASKQHTGAQLAEMFGRTVPQIRKFVEDNRKEIEAAHLLMNLLQDELPLDDESGPKLWITDKNKRLLIYQKMAELLFVSARITFDATVLRELRSYMYYAAQELGQLQHRGSATGDGNTTTYEIPGLNLELLQ